MRKVQFRNRDQRCRSLPMETRFELHPRLAADTLLIGDWPLGRVLLMNDRQYPWCILVPRRADVRESFALAAEDRAQLWAESLALGESLMRHFRGDKLNVAALGNLVPQLHWHHIVRFAGDPAWPAPVWGKLPAQPYDAPEAERLLGELRALLGAAFPLQ
jgi:diadenosine tetraphosphate (Ap4A) HIT family hydrolase